MLFTLALPQMTLLSYAQCKENEQTIHRLEENICKNTSHKELLCKIYIKRNPLETQQ